MQGMNERSAFDVIIAGGGMAGVSAAYELACAGQAVLVLEQEAQTAFHTTGRSAAMYALGYGPDPIVALTAASKEFYTAPPAGFAENPLKGPSVGCLFIGRADQTASLDAEQANLSRLIEGVERMTAAEAMARIPVLRADYVAGAVYEPLSATLDVNEIFMGFLRGATKAGARVETNAALVGAAFQNGVWQVETAKGVFEAPVLINAAGAWADDVARRCGVTPKAVTPKRRTAITFAAPAAVQGQIADWPLVIDVDEEFYFKHEAGLLLASPCDETPMPPHDVQPDEMDIAICADKVMRAATLDIQRISHKWAGLRSFAPDGAPIVGFDAQNTGFFWLVGQGGYGIQTAPAMARLASALVQGQSVPADIVQAGLNPAHIAPER